MVSTADVKFYKVGAAGLGGTISATQITTAISNNLFSNVTGAERIVGEDYYLAIAAKNTNADEAWIILTSGLIPIAPPTDTTWKWGFDAAGNNGTAQTIADQFTAPTSVTWHTAGNEPPTPNVGKLKAGEYVPIWIWSHVEAGAASRPDDTAIFNFTLFIPRGGSPDPGSGGGGETTSLDVFGISKIYATASGGRTYNSNWHTATSHEWDATGGQVPAANLDPQDFFADLISPTTCRAIVDATTKTLTADTNADRNSWRYYIKDPADTAAYSTWKWSESVEITVYYKAGQSYAGGSIHVHCRLMGPGEHWNAIDKMIMYTHRPVHKYLMDSVNQGERCLTKFRKEEFHKSVAYGEGYAENIIFT